MVSGIKSLMHGRASQWCSMIAVNVLSLTNCILTDLLLESGRGYPTLANTECLSRISAECFKTSIPRRINNMKELQNCSHVDKTWKYNRDYGKGRCVLAVRCCSMHLQSAPEFLRYREATGKQQPLLRSGLRVSKLPQI